MFSRYDNEVAEAKNEQIKEFFVPKAVVETHPGKGHCFDMATHKFTALCSKYLYISDKSISGHADNKTAGTSSTGVTYNNNYFVLRYVIGV